MARANPCSFLYSKIWTNVSSNSMNPLYPEGIVLWKMTKSDLFVVSLSRLSFLVHNGAQQFVGIAQFTSGEKIFLLSKSYPYQGIKGLFCLNFSIPGHLIVPQSWVKFSSHQRFDIYYKCVSATRSAGLPSLALMYSKPGYAVWPPLMNTM